MEYIELDPGYSTTRRVQKADPTWIAFEIKAASKREDWFENFMFLPEGEERKGEGGLRKRGYFKQSYVDMPLITVVTVVINGSQFLEETILSVINQPYDNIEYIIIDGGSTDRTLDIIRKYENAIDYWASEKDSGIYDAMNKSWSLCDFWARVIFLGSGDKLISLPLIDELKSHVDDVIYGDVEIGARVFNSKLTWKTRIYNTIHHQALLVPKRLCQCLKPFNFKYRIYADYDLNLRLLNKNSRFIKSKSFKSYAMPGGISSSLNRKEMLAVCLKNNGVLFSLLAILFHSLATIKNLKILPIMGRKHLHIK